MPGPVVLKVRCKSKISGAFCFSKSIIDSERLYVHLILDQCCSWRRDHTRNHGLDHRLLFRSTHETRPTSEGQGCGQMHERKYLIFIPLSFTKVLLHLSCLSFQTSPGVRQSMHRSSCSVFSPFRIRLAQEQ